MPGCFWAISHSWQFFGSSTRSRSELRRAPWRMSYLGRPSTVRGAYARIRAKFWKLIGVVFNISLRVFGIFLLILLVVGGLVAAIALAPECAAIPSLWSLDVARLYPLLYVAVLAFCVWFALRYAISIPVLMIENLGVLDTLRRSVFLTRGRRGHIFLGLLVATIIAYVGIFLFQGPFTVAVMIDAMRGQWPFWLASYIGSGGRDRKRDHRADCPDRDRAVVLRHAHSQGSVRSAIHDFFARPARARCGNGFSGVRRAPLGTSVKRAARRISHHLSCWRLLCLQLCVNPARRPRRPLTLQEYTSELDRCSAVLNKHQSDPAAFRNLRATLPAQWTVADGGQVYTVSTEWLTGALAALRSDTPASNPLLVGTRQRLAALRAAAESLEEQSHSANSQQSRAQLDHILSAREFQNGHGPSWFDLLKARVYDWIGRQLERLFGHFRHGRTIGNAIAWTRDRACGSAAGALGGACFASRREDKPRWISTALRGRRAAGATGCGTHEPRPSAAIIAPRFMARIGRA